MPYTTMMLSVDGRMRVTISVSQAEAISNTQIKPLGIVLDGETNSCPISKTAVISERFLDMVQPS